LELAAKHANHCTSAVIAGIIGIDHVLLDKSTTSIGKFGAGMTAH